MIQNLVTSIVIISLSFFGSCGEYRSDVGQILPDPPTFSTIVALEDKTRQACGISEETISREVAQEKSVLRNILKGAPDRGKCGEFLATQFHTYFYGIDPEIKKALTSGKVYKPYDVVIIGTGPMGSILASNFRHIAGLNVLLIEREHLISSHFKSTIFNLLTSEKQGKSWNPFPGSPVEVKDFMVGNVVNVFPVAIDLWKQIVMTLFASKAGFLHDDVSTVQRMAEPAATPIYQLSLKSGLKLQARSVIFATGLGILQARHFDEQSLALLAAARPLTHEQPLPPAIYIDYLIEWAELQRTAGKDALTALKNKNVAIIGGGNGAKMLVKYMTGKASPIAYEFGDPAYTPSSIFNIGKGLRNRVVGITEYVSGSVDSIALKPNTLSVNNAVATIQFIREGAGGAEEKDFDHVVVAGGYERQLEMVLAPMLPSNSTVLESMQDIMGKAYADKPEEKIATQFVKNNQPEMIFFVGSAMQPKVASIWEFSYKSAAFPPILKSKILIK